VIAGNSNILAFVSTFDDSAKPSIERNPAYQQQVVTTIAVPTR
jgi:hypothetical protein